MIFKKIFSVVATFFALSIGVWAQNSVDYGYFRNTEFGNWGTGKAETYNLAIKIDNPALRGLQVSAVKIPINIGAKYTSDYEAFLTHQLGVKSGKATADIISVPFTPDSLFTIVQFEQPYTIGAEPFYAGFTFKVNQLDATNKKPVKITYDEHINGFMVATSRTYRTWRNNAEKIKNIVPITLILNGNITDNAAVPTQLQNIRLQISTTGMAHAVITNVGTTDIQNIDYIFEVDGKQTAGHFEMDQPIESQFFASTGNIQIDAPAIGKLGTYEGSLRITKVNGVANSKADVALKNQVSILEFVPIHRAVMEEFTGTWCQYCPRGWVGMEMLKERYPDKFIALSYHNGDIMEITDMFPVAVDGFPSSTIDRGPTMDPYFGSVSGTRFGIEKDWKKRCLEPAPAEITVTAKYNSDMSKIEITSHTRFAENAENHNYSIAYAVTADSLCGTSSLWMQANGFTGMRNPGDLEFFANNPNKVFIPFNDVVIAVSNYKGIEGSLPAVIQANEIMNHSFSFDVADMYSSLKQDTHLIQNYNKVNVVALLVNNQTGRIENANKCHVEGACETGIEEVLSNQRLQVVARYNLSGVQVNEQYKGITLLRMSDGSVKKVFQP